MREEMWRLYRHLIFSGVAIIACCYLVIEFTQIRFGISKTEQLLCVDSEISSAILLSGLSKQLPESQFDWTLASLEPLSIVSISSLLKKEKWLKHPDNSYQVSFQQLDKPVLTGLSVNPRLYFQFETLLERLLLTDRISDSEKMMLLKSMTCLSVASYDSDSHTTLSGVALIHNSNSEYGFLWKDESAEKTVYLSVVHEENVPFSLVVIIVVTMGITVMLLLIWRELMALDMKRKTFESITRQIARGRSGLPQSVPDSSGTLKELAYSFDSMSSHIERLLKVQREMINAISHELRTPIARLRFGLEMMKDEVDDSAAHMIEALEGDVEELNTLVDEVLTYGKLEGGSLELHFKETSVSQLIDGILHHNHLLLQHLCVDVRIDSTDDIALVDEHHINRALQNLILNAAKYAASTITISFFYDEERWQLDIEDDGPGIAFEDRDKVFIPFQRLDNSRTRASGGYGLGLAIVQRIAFWHGGAVLIDASEAGGAKFSFIWSRNQHQNTLS